MKYVLLRSLCHGQDCRHKEKLLASPLQQVDGLEPEKKGVHIICKVLEVKTEERSRLDGTTTKTATATVGDKKGCIVLIARGAHIDVLKQDAVLVIFNAHIEMYNKGFMRLVVDRYAAHAMKFCFEHVDSTTAISRACFQHL